VGLERLVHHVTDDLTRRVEAAKSLASGGACVLVVGGEEVFENFAKQLWIEGDFFFERSVLLVLDQVFFLLAWLGLSIS
jgi:hypothetical protein